MFGVILNIVIGLVFVVGGLSGQLAFRGTNSGPLLALAGAALLLWGIYRAIQLSRRA